MTPPVDDLDQDVDEVVAVGGEGAHVAGQPDRRGRADGAQRLDPDGAAGVAGDQAAEIRGEVA